MSKRSEKPSTQYRNLWQGVGVGTTWHKGHFAYWAELNGKFGIIRAGFWRNGHVRRPRFIRLLHAGEDHGAWEIDFYWISVAWKPTTETNTKSKP